MKTEKQLRAAYMRIIKARIKLHIALRDAENIGLVICPDNYEEGYWKPFNCIFKQIDEISSKPLAEAAQKTLRKDVYGY
jgi:hypothetical protein